MNEFEEPLPVSALLLRAKLSAALTLRRSSRSEGGRWPVAHKTKTSCPGPGFWIVKYHPKYLMSGCHENRSGAPEPVLETLKFREVLQQTIRRDVTWSHPGKQADTTGIDQLCEITEKADRGQATHAKDETIELGLTEFQSTLTTIQTESVQVMELQVVTIVSWENCLYFYNMVGTKYKFERENKIKRCWSSGSPAEEEFSSLQLVCLGDTCTRTFITSPSTSLFQLFLRKKKPSQREGSFCIQGRMDYFTPSIAWNALHSSHTVFCTIQNYAQSVIAYSKEHRLTYENLNVMDVAVSLV
ncbi:Protein Shroom1 [Manis pentadactyla]|nr:Protein Shroom1 [Manis pentadactyla]